MEQCRKMTFRTLAAFFGKSASRTSGVRQSHLPHRDGSVAGARSSSQHQQQIGQVLGHVFILFLPLLRALLPEGLVLERQAACGLLRPVLDQVRAAAVASVRAERLQLDGSVRSQESERCREALVLERPGSGVLQLGLNHHRAVGPGVAVPVAGAQTHAAVVDLPRGTGAWQRGDLRPAQGGEAVPPQAAGGGVLALAPSEQQHTVPVDHRRVAHEPGWAGPGVGGGHSTRDDLLKPEAFPFVSPIAMTTGRW